MNKKYTNSVLAVLTTTLLAACVTPQPGGMSNGSSNIRPTHQAAQEDPCSVGRSALAGAAVGALLGGLMNGKKGALRGAAAGGVVASLGCLAINAQTRQTKTAAETDREFVQARGSLPAAPQVVSYNPTTSSTTGRRGQPLHVNSVIELVNGSQQRVNEVREELVVFDPQGEKFQNGSKQLTNKTGGRFENSFELILPESAPQGVYAMKTNLYVNGKLSASRNLQTQIVFRGDGTPGVLMASR